jgi:hypothetical protein
MKYFDWIKQNSGLQAQMRLAMKTSIPSSKAESLPDDPATLQKMHAAAKEIAGSEPPQF